MLRGSQLELKFQGGKNKPPKKECVVFFFNMTVDCGLLVLKTDFFVNVTLVKYLSSSCKWHKH